MGKVQIHVFLQPEFSPLGGGWDPSSDPNLQAVGKMFKLPAFVHGQPSGSPDLGIGQAGCGIQFDLHLLAKVCPCPGMVG